MSDFDFIIGFDFGHGETSVAMVDVSRVSLQDGTVPSEDIYICEHSHEPKITSLVGYDFNGSTDVDIDIYDFKGFDHIEAYFKGPLVGSDNFRAINDIQKKHFKDFIVTVYEKLMSNPKNVKLVGHRVKYYAACPSGWNPEQREAYLEFLRNDCQLPIAGIIEESRAAHVTARKKLYERNRELSEKAKRIVVLDLGSSTLDITLHSDKTYTDGYEIGASQIEGRLLSYFLAENEDFKQSYNEYISHYMNGKDDILLFLRYAKEEYFNKQKKYPGKEMNFSCSIDWEDLSQDKVVGDSKLKMRGSEFISLLLNQGSSEDANNYESRLRSYVGEFIAKFGKADAIILTGGASQMEFYKNVVLDCFALDEKVCIVDETPSYSISQGVAVIGYMDSKCPIFGDNVALPKDLQDLSDNLPDIINADILTHYQFAYTNTMVSAVNEWRYKNGQKTLEELIKGLDNLIEDWYEQRETVSSRINESVSDTVSHRIEQVLRDTIRLYFGFDAPVKKFDMNYTFNFAIPDEDNKKLFANIIALIKRYIDNRGLFHKWNGNASLEKDRSGDSDLVNGISQMIEDYATSWFAKYHLEDSIDVEVADCRFRLREFYIATIKDITCQI